MLTYPFDKHSLSCSVCSGHRARHGEAAQTRKRTEPTCSLRSVPARWDSPMPPPSPAALGESHVFLGRLLSFRKHRLRARRRAAAGGEGRQASPLQGGRQKGKEAACPSSECDREGGPGVFLGPRRERGSAFRRRAREGRTEAGGGDGDGHSTGQRRPGRRRPTPSFHP